MRVLGAFLLGLFLWCGASVAKADTTPRVVGYFTNWAQYRPGQCKFTPANIRPEYFTHINYAFAKIGAGDQVQPVEWNDISSGGSPGLYEQVNAIKQQSPHLRTLISIGGWTLSDAFPAMASTATRRANFIKSAINYARTYGFDGVDLDWEYPGFATHSGTAQDKKNFTALLKEFRQAIESERIPNGKEKLLLTIAAPAGDGNFVNYELSLIHPYLDWINLMTYDFHGSWDSVTGVNSPLMHDSAPNGHFYVDYTVSAYLNAGIPASKLILGIPLYGRGFGSASGNVPNSTITNPWNPNPPRGSCTQEAGFIAYYEIEQWINSGQYQRGWDANTQTPYAYDGKGNWISYDDTESIERKLTYLGNKQLGGAMVWAIDLDDQYSLISLISQTLYGEPPPAPTPSPTPTPTPTPTPDPVPTPSPTPTPTPTPAPTPTPSPGGSLTQNLSPDFQLQLVVDNSWGQGEPWSGATYKATLKNISNSKTFNQVQIKANQGNGLNVWSMEPVQKTASETVVGLPSYNNTLDPGESYTFGFTMSPLTTPQFSLQNATELTPPSPAPSPTPDPSPPQNPSEGSMVQNLASGLTLTLSIDSEWGRGEAWSGANIKAVLKNTTKSTTFSGLRISANAGTGFSPWSMDLISKTSTQTVLQLPSWQKNLGPGQSFTFGFTIAPIRIPVFKME